MPAPSGQRVVGPAMNNRVADRIADLLRREARRENQGIDA
jgi:hypothetical protein